MKFQFNQTVILFDTEYKPAGNAIVRDYNDEQDKYQVEYRYPGSERTENIWIPAGRLAIITPKVANEIDPE
jgi:hypothetical protein